MCGRFYADAGLEREIRELVRSLEGERNASAQESARSGFLGKSAESEGEKWDVLPSQEAPVLCRKSHRFLTESMAWGFPALGGGGLLINARAESALEKKTFRESVLCRRCVIPARGFYEWNSQKEKSWFFREDGQALCLAGFYDLQRDRERFVVLTTAANASVAPVHSRMPLILEKSQVSDWILDDKAAEAFLQLRPGQLRRQSEYQQLSLW